MSNHVPNPYTAYTHLLTLVEDYVKTLQSHKSCLSFGNQSFEISQKEKNEKSNISDAWCDLTDSGTSAHDTLRAITGRKTFQILTDKITKKMATFTKAIFLLKTTQTLNLCVHTHLFIENIDDDIHVRFLMMFDKKTEYASKNPECYIDFLKDRTSVIKRIKFLEHIEPVLNTGSNWIIFKNKYQDPRITKSELLRVLIRRLTLPDPSTALTLHMCLNEPNYLFSEKTPQENGYSIYQETEETPLLNIFS